MLRFLFILLSTFFSIFVQAQNVEYFSVTIKDRSGNTIKNPFTGGIRAAQFNKIDLNRDGIKDLLIFDGAGNVFTPMLATKRNSTDYTFAPQYISIFPPIKEWVIVQDYDRDGIEDIFCFPTQSAIPGIEVWKGKLENGVLGFNQVKFPEFNFDILSIARSQGRTQVFVSVVDIPVINDVDGDGDMDVLSFEVAGSAVTFYRNMQKENNLDSTALEFVLQDGCYGKFLENTFTQDVSLSVDGKGCANSNLSDYFPQTRHAGSTIEIFDHDGDNLIDILLGDIGYNGINMLENGGSVSSAWITKSNPRFPNNNPVTMELFLTPKYIDADNDGLKDLLISTNDIITSQTIDHLWYYKNQTDSGFEGQLISKNFILGDMIGLGENSVPVFVDYNQDGLMDIVVGSSGHFVNTSQKNPSLFLFENVGSKTNPEYHLIDNDYLGYNQFKSTSSFFAPSFGDLDGDGDQDMMVGDDRGKLYFSENIAGSGNEFRFKSAQYEFSEITVSGFAKPHIVDLNGDDLGDILIGERNFNNVPGFPVASFNYFQNIGSVGNPQFEKNVESSPNSAAFGGINLKIPGFINNHSAATIWKNNDHFLLITGSEPGNLRIFKGNYDALDDVFEDITSGNLMSLSVGLRSSPALADIDNDGLLEILVGNYRGGLNLYKSDISYDNLSTSTDEVDVDLSFQIVPNPSKYQIEVKIPEEIIPSAFEIINLEGKKVLSAKNNTVQIASLASGIYFVVVKSTKGVFVKKFVKQ